MIADRTRHPRSNQVRRTGRARQRGNGGMRSQHVWSERYVNAPVLRDRDADTSGDGTLEERLYYQSDANFNVTALIESDGDVVERSVYDSYGATKFLDANWTSSSVYSAYSNDVLFQGGKRDIKTGLVNFQMRDLSTGLGRWVQVDPWGYVDGMSLYEFVGSNPQTFLDPWGTALIVAPIIPETQPQGIERALKPEDRPKPDYDIMRPPPSPFPPPITDPTTQPSTPEERWPSSILPPIGPIDLYPAMLPKLEPLGPGSPRDPLEGSIWNPAIEY